MVCSGCRRVRSDVTHKASNQDNFSQSAAQATDRLTDALVAGLVRDLTLITTPVYPAQIVLLE